MLSGSRSKIRSEFEVTGGKVEKWTMVFGAKHKVALVLNEASKTKFLTVGSADVTRFTPQFRHKCAENATFALTS